MKKKAGLGDQLRGFLRTAKRGLESYGGKPTKRGKRSRRKRR